MNPLSLNELEMSARKAASALGWPFGLAEEFGRATVWSAVHLPEAIPSLLDLAELGHGPANCTRTGRTATFENSGAASAIAVFDLLAAGVCDRVVFRSARRPTGLLGFAGAASDAFGMAFTVECGGGRATVGGDLCRLTGSLHRNCEVGIEVAVDAACSGLRPPKDGVEIEAAVRHRLGTLAARCLGSRDRDVAPDRSRCRNCGHRLTGAIGNTIVAANSISGTGGGFGGTLRNAG